MKLSEITTILKDISTADIVSFTQAGGEYSFCLNLGGEIFTLTKLAKKDQDLYSLIETTSGAES